MEQARLNLILTPEAAEALDKLGERLGSSSKSETIRRSLRICEILTRPHEEVFVKKPGDVEPKKVKVV